MIYFCLLYRYIPDNVYNWIVRYFTEHEHCTVYEGEVSTFEKVNASVIQGSSIGPSSYDVVASDLHPVVEKNKLVKFVDDFDLIIPGCNVDSRGQELDNVQKWSVENNLQLNRKKSREIVFVRQHSHSVCDVPLIPDIPRVSSLKLLGVTLTHNFSMEEHVADVISSSAGSLYALCILRLHGMSAQNFHSVFKATVFSKLQYASPSWWGFMNSAQHDRLEGFLRKSARVGFVPNDSQSFSAACYSADDTLYHRIISDDNHPLQSFLPPKLSRTYNMRARAHDYQLPLKQNSLHEKNFLIRMFYKN